MHFHKPLITTATTLFLAACGGGSGSDNETVDLGLDLDLEDYLMQFIDEDINYVGSEIPPDIEFLAAKNSAEIFEANTIPMHPDCAWRIYSEDGAFIDIEGQNSKHIYFDEGGRLSGGFSTKGTGVAGSDTTSYRRQITLIDEDREHISLSRSIEINTPGTYGKVILVDVTTIGYVDKVVRIVGGYRGLCTRDEWS